MKRNMAIWCLLFQDMDDKIRTGGKRHGGKKEMAVDESISH